MHVLAVHDQIKNVGCQVEGCLVMFKNEAEMKIHVKYTHLKMKRAKTFQCSICEYSTYNRKLLRDHDAGQHQTEKPFGCEICCHRFKQELKLRQHIKNKHSLNKLS